MLIDITPFIIISLYLYILLFKINITVTSSKSSKMYNFTTSQHETSPVIFLLAFFIFLVIFFFKPTINTMNFIVNNKVVIYFLSYLIILCFYLKSDNSINIKSMVSLLFCGLFSFLLSTTMNFFYLLVLFEVNFYLFLLLIITSYNHKQYNTLPSFFKNIFIILVLNFITTLSLYLITYYFITVYGFTFLTSGLKLNNYIIMFLLVKFSVGPWFLWNISVYHQLTQGNIFYYTLIFFLLQAPLLLNTLVLIGNGLSITVLLFLLILGLSLNYNIYNIVSNRELFLFSSFTTYIFLLFILV